jgi:hypothetical protein
LVSFVKYNNILDSFSKLVMILVQISYLVYVIEPALLLVKDDLYIVYHDVVDLQNEITFLAAYIFGIKIWTQVEFQKCKTVEEAVELFNKNKRLIKMFSFLYVVVCLF